MNITDAELDKLRKHLKAQYPSHHWALVETIDETKPAGAKPREEA